MRATIDPLLGKLDDTIDATKKNSEAVTNLTYQIKDMVKTYERHESDIRDHESRIQGLEDSKLEEKALNDVKTFSFRTALTAVITIIVTGTIAAIVHMIKNHG